MGGKITDGKLKHAAAITAEWLDNNEDGLVDDVAANNAIARRNGAVLLVNNEQGDENVFGDRFGNNAGITWSKLVVHQIPPEMSNGNFDASLEEILHLIHDTGYMYAHPDLSPGETLENRVQGSTKLTDAMDTARGGNFMTVLAQYPSDAWYSYDDVGCDYRCQAGEYFFWLVSSVLGTQVSRCNDIRHEWSLCTREQVQATDTTGYPLITNPAHNLPTVLPDGRYR